MPVEVGIVHDGGMSALFASAPLRTEAVVEALAVAILAAAHVVSVGVHPQEPHQRVQLAHLWTKLINSGCAYALGNVGEGQVGDSGWLALAGDELYRAEDKGNGHSEGLARSVVFPVSSLGLPSRTATPVVTKLTRTHQQ